MTRRSFLKLIIHFLAIVTGVMVLKRNEVANSQTFSVATSYGSGSYGAGAYSSYALYLPVVKKGGN